MAITAIIRIAFIPFITVLNGKVASQISAKSITKNCNAYASYHYDDRGNQEWEEIQKDYGGTQYDALDRQAFTFDNLNGEKHFTYDNQGR